MTLKLNASVLSKPHLLIPLKKLGFFPGDWVIQIPLTSNSQTLRYSGEAVFGVRLGVQTSGLVEMFTY